MSKVDDSIRHDTALSLLKGGIARFEAAQNKMVKRLIMSELKNYAELLLTPPFDDREKIRKKNSERNGLNNNKSI